MHLKQLEHVLDVVAACKGAVRTDEMYAGLERYNRVAAVGRSAWIGRMCD